METKIMQEIINSLNKNIKVALITLVDVNGSTPADSGDMMLVWEDGRTVGTIGGGKLEYEVTKEAIEAIKQSKNFKFSHSLKSDGDLKMQCGGLATGFIKIFIPKNKLIMIGGGHIGENIVDLAKFLDFHVTVIDDREEFFNKASLQKADEIIISNYSNFLEKINIDSNTFIVIATKGHLGDQEALEQVVKSNAKYIGVIGSKSKTAFLKAEILKKGFSEEDFSNVYAPIGLNIANQNPKEIGISILSEILLIKNSKKLKHMDFTKSSI